MKILLTTDLYDPVVNGVVTSVNSLKEALTASGHEVRILTLSESLHSHATDCVSYVGSVNANKIYPQARLRARFARKLIHDILRWHPDVVHSQCEFSTFLIARKICKRLDIPLVHTYHTVYEDYTHYFCPSRRIGKKVVSKLSSALSRRCDLMVAPTEKVRDLLKKYQVSSPVFVSPTGISLEKFSRRLHPERRQKLRQDLGLDADALVLVFVGRLAKEKNLEEILSFLPDCPAHSMLLVVGDGPNRPYLEEQAIRLGVQDRVLFTGMIPPSLIADYYQLGDIFVSASTSETQGLTYIEALASGVPLLCRRDACLLDIVDTGSNGWLYETKAEFLACVQNYPTSASQRRIFSENAGRTAQQFSLEHFGQQMESIYLHAMNFRETANI